MSQTPKLCYNEEKGGGFMNWFANRIENIDIQTFYGIVALRIKVFIIEQKCLYEELDHKDFSAVHLYAKDANQQLVAYLRILDPGVSYEEVSIGRVVVSPDYRHLKIGRTLMQKGIQYVRDTFGLVSIRISAQAYLLNFYQSLGFRAVSEIYLEDDIPHIEMLLDIL